MAKKIADKKLSFILHEEKKPPKYFELDKGLLKFLLFGLPIISLLSLVTLIVISVYFKQFKNHLEAQRPQIIEKTKESNQALLNQQKELNMTISSLQNKLSANVPSTFDNLSLIRPAHGQKDLSKSVVLSIENFRVTPAENNKLQVKFHLKNLTDDNNRISGYAFVVMKEQNFFHFYPEGALADNDYQTEFNKGELFGFSRLRPITATFTVQKNQSPKIFLIFIFSYTGDLIHFEKQTYIMNNSSEGKNV